MPFAQDGTLGVALTTTSTTPLFALGTRIRGSGDTEFVYVQANGAITGAGYALALDETFQAVMLSTANDARGDNVAAPLGAFADDEYGWVQTKGPCQLRVAANCAANARLNTTATAGQLDDDGTAGAFEILGVVLTTANGGSAGLAPCVLNFATQGAALP
jgi:hypothetical protein